MHANLRYSYNFLRGFFLICLALLWVARAVADTNSPANTNTNAGTNVADVEGRNAEAVIIGTQESLRSSLAIQEQLRNMQVSIEKDRKDAEAATARNLEIFEGRVKLLEASNNSKQFEELKRLQSENRVILIAAGAFAVVGFVVLLFAAFVQWTAVNRLATLSARLPRALGLGPVPGELGMGETALLSSAAGGQPATQLLGVIEKLEKRIDSIEKTSTHPASPGNGAALEPLAEPASGDHEPVGAVALLMGKGQTLLKLDKPEQAVAAFDEALAIDPDNTDVLVRKGAALERLQRMDDAIACYDLAIAADKTMTMAYLYKGGVYNRMERYSEALECYEQALKTQQKGHAANVIIGD